MAREVGTAAEDGGGGGGMDGGLLADSGEDGRHGGSRHGDSESGGKDCRCRRAEASDGRDGREKASDGEDRRDEVGRKQSMSVRLGCVRAWLCAVGRRRMDKMR